MSDTLLLIVWETIMFDTSPNPAVLDSVAQHILELSPIIETNYTHRLLVYIISHYIPVTVDDDG